MWRVRLENDAECRLFLSLNLNNKIISQDKSKNKSLACKCERTHFSPVPTDTFIVFVHSDKNASDVMKVDQKATNRRSAKYKSESETHRRQSIDHTHQIRLSIQLMLTSSI